MVGEGEDACGGEQRFVAFRIVRDHCLLKYLCNYLFQVFLEVSAKIDLNVLGERGSAAEMLKEASLRTGAQFYGECHVTGTFDQVKDFRQLLKDMISAQAAQTR